jgi:hypothetical protein
MSVVNTDCVVIAFPSVHSLLLLIHYLETCKNFPSFQLKWRQNRVDRNIYEFAPSLVDFFSKLRILVSVADPKHFYAAPAAPAPTLLYSKAKFLK